MRFDAEDEMDEENLTLKLDANYDDPDESELDKFDDEDEYIDEYPEWESDDDRYPADEDEFGISESRKKENFFLS